MTDLLSGQIDFIYFVYGLGFILLLPICLYLTRRPRSSLPWMWLLLFGATHGLLEWLDLAALNLGTNPVFDVVRLGMLVLSFLLLAEFGRAGLVMLRGRGPGRWVLAILLGLALLGAFAGLPGIRASTRYALGLVGALGAAVALWLAAPRAAQGRSALQGAALCLAGYAAAAGLVVDPAPFFPASLLNTDVFLSAVGVPIQLGRGFLAAGLSGCLSLFAVASLGQEKTRRLQKWGRNLMVGTVVSVLVLVITGCFVTQYLGRYAAREVRAEQEHRRQVLQFVLMDKMAEADHLATILAGAPGIISYLSSRTSQNCDRANMILDRYSASQPGAINYVLDREGLTIASSNRLAPDSFLGKSYAFRPYFQQALQGAKGSYWALGVTSGKLGYYASFPVRDDRGKIIGVAVIKRTMRDLNGLFPQEAPAVIINADGVVTLANRPDMFLRSLWPLSAVVREQLIASRQFGPGPFAPILAQAPVDGGDCRFQGRPYLVLRQPLPFQDWSIVILTSPRSITVARLLGISIAILSCLMLLSLLTIIGLTIESTLRVQRSENRFRQLHENLRDGSAVVDLSGKIVECNPAFLAMLGYPPGELVKLSHQDITPKTWHEQEARIIDEQVLLKGYSNLYEKEYRRRDGSVFPVELQTYLVQEEVGQPPVMWVFVRDITERRGAEETLRESEKRYRQLFESMISGFALHEIIMDKDGKPCDYRFLEVNAAFEKQTGLKGEDLVGRTLIESLPAWEPFWIETYGRVAATGESLHFESYSKELDRHYEVAAYAPGPGQLATIFRDITERKRTEEALEKRLIALTQPMDETASLRFSDLFNIEDIQRIQDAFAEATGVASIITHPDGTPITKPSNFCRLCIEIIRETEKGLANCCNSDSVIGRFNPQGPIIQTCLSGGLWDAGASIAVGGKHIAKWLIGQVKNEGVDEDMMLRYAQEIGANPEAFRKALAEVPVMSSDQFERIADTLFLLANELSEKAYQNVQQARFITDHKRAAEEHLEMELRLLHAQKLESLGVMAGGIAHDFNNLLMSVLGNLELALMGLSPASSTRPHIEQAGLAAKRAADLTQHMLAYSGKSQLVIKDLNLNEVVEENAYLQRAATPKSVSLNLQLGQNLPLIRADAGQIQQIVMNLITNASEAIGEQTGRVGLATGVQECDEAYLSCSSLEEKPRPGRFVWLEVTDTGCGMDAATQQRLFDPFFTTKFTGRGLGLSAVLGIVRGHQGALLLDSKLGRGTTVRVLFPVSETAAAVEGQTAATGTLRGEAPSLSGTVLLVDDEETVRSVSRAMLEALGFSVLTAADGLEALELYRERGEEIDLVLLDITMPHMDGAETLRELRRHDPDVRVILSSGYTEQDIASRFAGKGLRGFIQKPFTLATLRAALRRVLSDNEIS